ncbi:hypothetical protein AB0I98_04030 [Streptomyces sp. NPDC050211]|uniref:hypothetical protein n=1 Tax=Streptomyces sp. NPDC050211 TaxID=3154932 RepID=UPI00342FC6AC
MSRSVIWNALAGAVAIVLRLVLAFRSAPRPGIWRSSPTSTRAKGTRVDVVPD